jgi:N-acetylglucosaminyl-diphospho-decaprenol L-rhamnosyltransferase
VAIRSNSLFCIMQAPLQVAVVVVSYNTRELLLECLASVVDGTAGTSTEIVVVDNDSADGSYNAVGDAYPQVIAIHNSVNLGFGAACNQGIRSTRSPFILLLNSDARLTRDAFDVLLGCLEREARCAAAGCRLIDAAGDEVVNTRNFLTPFNQAFETAGFKFNARALSRTYRPVFDRDSVDCSVDWIDGACLILRRAALDEIGLFDERFFMYSEDEDLCLALKKRGWLVCFCGAATAVHHGAASSEHNRIAMLRQFYLSQMLFLSKHRGPLSAFLYTASMKVVLILKQSFLRDVRRRERAREHLAALRHACASEARTTRTKLV